MKKKERTGLWKRATSVLMAGIMTFSMLPLDRVEAAPEKAESQQVQADAQGKERSVDFNNGWKFQEGSPLGAQEEEFDDSSWQNVTLPHDWAIYNSFTSGDNGNAQQGYLNTGNGWYRKTFSLTEDQKGKRISIDFDGVMYVSTVYVNGIEVGKEYYGYTAFSYDITDLLHQDGENVIAVKCENSKNNSRWYTGAGIYRNVTLTVTEDVHVARNGTYITFPIDADTDEKTFSMDKDAVLAYIADGKAKADIATEVANDSEEEREVTLKTEMLDEQGVVAASETSLAEVQAQDSYTFEQDLEITDPHLWSTEDPYLYTVRSTVMLDGQTVDIYETTVGIRYLTFTSDHGFFLNGEHMKLWGVCMHHDLGALGAAVNERATERQLQMLKEMGANAIRTSHNPASRVLIELCNKMGILVIEEAFDMWVNKKGSGDYARFFPAHGEEDTKAMIDRDKNDPSVIMWSIGNEPSASDCKSGVVGSVSGKEEWTEGVVPELMKWVRSIDQTRPTTWNNRYPFHKYGDMIHDMIDVPGFSYRTAAEYDKYHEEHPDWIMVGSEVGSHYASRGYYLNQDDPMGADPESNRDSENFLISSYEVEGNGAPVTRSWVQDRDREYSLGEFVWTGFDYIGEPTPFSGQQTTLEDGTIRKPKSSYFGLIDTAGLPKDSYYLYQSIWTTAKENPMVHLLPHWNWEEGEQIEVWAYTNAKSVELFINGKSQGIRNFETKYTSYGLEYRETEDGKLWLDWDTVFEAGELKAVAYSEKDGQGEVIATDVIQTAGNEDAVRLTPDRRSIKADGKDLSFITVDVVDNQDITVPDADNLITFEVEGGEIAGVDNGDGANVEPYQANYRSVFSGKAVLIVRSDGSGEPIRVTARSNGLTAGTTTVYTYTEEAPEKEEIVEILPVRTVTYLGEEPVLPTMVQAVYNDGSVEPVAVNWENFADYDESGEYQVAGTVQGSSVRAEATILVVDVIGVEPYTTAVTVGTVPELPDKVNLVYGDSNKRVTSVEWKMPEESVWNVTGTVTVTGTAEGSSYPATAIVRVGETVHGMEKQNILLAQEGNEYPVIEAAYTEGEASSATEKLNDGVISFSNSPKNRWSDYGKIRENDTNTITMTLGQKEEAVYDVDNMQVYYFTDNYGAAVPDSATIEYWDGEEWKEVEHLEEKVEDSRVYNYTFDAVKTSRIRLVMKQSGTTSNGKTKCLAITEMEIHADVAVEKPVVPYASAQVSDIRINGETLSGFSPDTYDYQVTLGWETGKPDITATPYENSRIMVVPPMKENGTYKILVTSEDGEHTAVYNIQVRSENAPLDKVELSMETAQIQQDTEAKIQESVTDQAGTKLSASEYQISWESSNESVLTVSEGTVRAIAPGQAVVTATVVYNGESLSATIEITVTKAPYEKVIVDFAPVELTVKKGETPSLPAKVTAEYDRGFPGLVEVTWDDYDRSLLEEYGTFTVKGTVQGTDLRPTANIKVLDIIAVEHISIATITGVNPDFALPESVQVYYSDGNDTQAPVVWNQASQEQYAKPGTFTLEGRVEGTDILAEASVRVTDEEIEGMDFATRHNDQFPIITASASEGGSTTEDICDGIVSYNDDEKNRWSTYGTGEDLVTLEYVIGNQNELPYNINQLEVDYFYDKYGSGAPDTCKIQYWDGEAWVDVQNQKQDVTEMTADGQPGKVGSTGGYKTIYTFDNIYTSRFRLVMDITQRRKENPKANIAITEIYGTAREVLSNNSASLSEIRIDGELLLDFDQDQTEYQVKREQNTIPQIEATAVDNGAVTIVPPISAEGEGRVIVVSESRAESRTYRLMFQVVEAPKADKAGLKAAIDLAMALDKADYTANSYQTLEQAIAKAKEVYQEPDVSQKDVDEQLQALLAAVNGLEIEVKASGEYQELLGQLNDKEQELAEKQTELEGLKGKLEKADQALTEAKDQVSEIQSQLNDAKQEIEKLKGEAETSTEELAKWEQKAKQLKELLLEAQNEVTSLEEEKAQLEGQIQTLETQVGLLNDQVEELTEKKAELEKALEKAEKERQQKEEELKQALKELEQLKAQQQTVPVTLKKGETATVKGIVYRVTDADGREVEAYKAKKKNIKSVTVPKTVKIHGITCKVTAIADKAFSNSKKLSKAVIGANVTRIGKRAFYGDKNLKKIIIKSKKIRKAGTKALRGISAKAVIQVPKGKKKAYTKLLKNRGQKKTVKIR